MNPFIYHYDKKSRDWIVRYENRVVQVKHINCNAPCWTVTLSSTHPDKAMSGYGTVLIKIGGDGQKVAYIDSDIAIP